MPGRDSVKTLATLTGGAASLHGGKIGQEGAPVPVALAVEQRMGRQTDAEVVRVMPIAPVMACTEARTREVRHFVVLITGRRQRFHHPGIGPGIVLFRDGRE